MKRLVILASLMFLLVVGVLGCSKQPAPAPNTGEVPEVNLTIAAAASLVDALNELELMYDEEKPNINLTFNLAASGVLQKQIEEGAPVDFFISAGKAQMDALVEKELVDAGSLKNLLGNELVLVVQADSEISSFDDLTTEAVEKISIGTPETVPAGKYAQETLTALNIWDEIQPKIVMGNDVRQVMTFVETQNVEAGLVYRSDAAQGKGIKIATAAPAASSKPIVYPMAIVSGTKYAKEAADFAEFLLSDEAMQVLVKYGFIDIRK